MLVKVSYLQYLANHADMVKTIIGTLGVLMLLLNVFYIILNGSFIFHNYDHIEYVPNKSFKKHIWNYIIGIVFIIVSILIPSQSDLHKDKNTFIDINLIKKKNRESR